MPASLTKHPSLLMTTKDCMKKSGVRYPDIVSAVDVVLLKTGYGIISEVFHLLWLIQRLFCFLAYSALILCCILFSLYALPLSSHLFFALVQTQHPHSSLLLC